MRRNNLWLCNDDFGSETSAILIPEKESFAALFMLGTCLAQGTVSNVAQDQIIEEQV